jgi:hypothetical protein
MYLHEEKKKIISPKKFLEMYRKFQKNKHIPIQCKVHTGFAQKCTQKINKRNGSGGLSLLYLDLYRVQT